MIVVDSSVWIEKLRGSDIPAVRRLHMIEDPLGVIVGDLVLVEVLQGARDDAHAAKIERQLRQYRIERMVDDRIAVGAARNYRALRARGVTPRKTIDVIIATYCLVNGHVLLHADRDFVPMVEHLGLRAL